MKRIRTRPELHLLVAEREDAVRSTIASLPDDQLRVIRLSFFDGFAHAEIAETSSAFRSAPSNRASGLLYSGCATGLVN